MKVITQFILCIALLPVWVGASTSGLGMEVAHDILGKITPDSSRKIIMSDKLQNAIGGIDLILDQSSSAAGLHKLLSNIDTWIVDTQDGLAKYQKSLHRGRSGRRVKTSSKIDFLAAPTMIQHLVVFKRALTLRRSRCSKLLIKIKSKSALVAALEAAKVAAIKKFNLLLDQRGVDLTTQTRAKKRKLKQKRKTAIKRAQKLVIKGVCPEFCVTSHSVRYLTNIILVKFNNKPIHSRFPVPNRHSPLFGYILYS